MTVISEENKTLSQKQWKLFLEGDNNAYALLYSTYVQQLFHFGCRFTTDHELIKDSIQDVFTKIYLKRTTLPSPDNIKVYLMTALKNNIFNQFDKKQVHHSFVSSVEQTEYDFDLSMEETIISGEDQVSQQQTIQQMLASLSARQREIIYYRFFEELDYNDICKLMDLNYQSAYNLLQRSLTKLRETYGISPILLYFLFTSLSVYKKII